MKTHGNFFNVNASPFFYSLFIYKPILNYIISQIISKLLSMWSSKNPVRWEFSGQILYTVFANSPQTLEQGLYVIAKNFNGGQYDKIQKMQIV